MSASRRVHSPLSLISRPISSLLKVVRSLLIFLMAPTLATVYSGLAENKLRMLYAMNDGGREGELELQDLNTGFTATKRVVH